MVTTIQPPSAFLPFLVKNVVKNHPISNASWVHNFQLQNPKLCEVMDLSLLILKYNFMGVGLQDFREGQVEK